MSPQVFTQGQGQPVEQWEFDRAQARIKNPKVDPRRVEQIAAKLKVTTPQYELLDR